MLETIEAEKLTEISGGLFDSPFAILAIPLLLSGWSRQQSAPAPSPTRAPAPVPGPPLEIRPPVARR